MQNTSERPERNYIVFELPEMMHGAGAVTDTQHDISLVLGFVEERVTFHQVGYACTDNAPDVLHQCADALIGMIQDQPILITPKLTAQDIFEKLDPAPEDAMHYCKMVLAALQQAFKSYLSMLHAQQEA